MIDDYIHIVPQSVPQFNSVYLPSQGQYKPVPVKDASPYGYPWQYNPMLHKAISEPSLCSRRNVFRIYLNNLVFYTRTNQQVADGLHSYYLYDEQGRITETGEVTLPIHFTDDNWYQYPYKDCKQQAAFIRSLGGRTNVMVATYNDTATTVGGEQLYFYPVKNIRGYALIQAHTPVDADGNYIAQNSSTHYYFIFNGKEDVEVSINVHVPVTARPSVVRQTEVIPQSAALVFHNAIYEQTPASPIATTQFNEVIQSEKRSQSEMRQQNYAASPAFTVDGISRTSFFADYHQPASSIPAGSVFNNVLSVFNDVTSILPLPPAHLFTAHPP